MKSEVRKRVKQGRKVSNALRSVVRNKNVSVEVKTGCRMGQIYTDESISPERNRWDTATTLLKKRRKRIISIKLCQNTKL